MEASVCARSFLIKYIHIRLNDAETWTFINIIYTWSFCVYILLKTYNFTFLRHITILKLRYFTIGAPKRKYLKLYNGHLYI